MRPFLIMIQRSDRKPTNIFRPVYNYQLNQRIEAKLKAALDADDLFLLVHQYAHKPLTFLALTINIAMLLVLVNSFSGFQDKLVNRSLLTALDLYAYRPIISFRFRKECLQEQEAEVLTIFPQADHKPAMLWKGRQVCVRRLNIQDYRFKQQKCQSDQEQYGSICVAKGIKLISHSDEDAPMVSIRVLHRQNCLNQYFKLISLESQEEYESFLQENCKKALASPVYNLGTQESSKFSQDNNNSLRMAGDKLKLVGIQMPSLKRECMRFLNPETRQRHISHFEEEFDLTSFKDKADILIFSFIAFISFLLVLICVYGQTRAMIFLKILATATLIAETVLLALAVARLRVDNQIIRTCPQLWQDTGRDGPFKQCLYFVGVFQSLFLLSQLIKQVI